MVNQLPIHCRNKVKCGKVEKDTYSYFHPQPMEQKELVEMRKMRAKSSLVSCPNGLHNTSETLPNLRACWERER